MKVTTDAMVFGALVHAPVPNHILDIGTGTGLLALMVAQRMPGQIEGVEIDEAAAQQAKHNFLESPWPQRLAVHHTPLQAFSPNQPYDLILTNPPFFANQLASAKAEKRQARHQGSLTTHHLLSFFHQHLTLQGTAWVLLPVEEADDLVAQSTEHGLYCTQKITLHSYPDSPAHRHVLLLAKQASETESVRSVTFYQGPDRTLTKQAYSLLSPYYLHL